MKRLFLFLLILSCIPINYAQQRWKINTDGGITWQVKKGDVHHDHIEMAGKQIAVVLRYGVDKTGAFELNKSMIWPMLRTIPNNTHGSLMRRFDWNNGSDQRYHTGKEKFLITETHLSAFNRITVID